MLLHPNVVVFPTFFHLFKKFCPQSFAAGAMVYVVVDDIVPEAHAAGNGKAARGVYFSIILNTFFLNNAINSIQNYCFVQDI